MKLTKPEIVKVFKPKKVIKTAKELENLFSDNVYDAINNVRENHISYGESPKKPCLHYKHSSIEANDELEKYIKEISGFFNYVPKDKQDKVWSKVWSDGHSD